MTPIWLLTIYCVLILLASLAGGLLPLIVPITHRWMELAVSFVAGLMLGVSLLHLLPHALAQMPAGSSPQQVMQWLLAGLLVMFLIERFFCFHHHDAPTAVQPEERPLAPARHAGACPIDDNTPTVVPCAPAGTGNGAGHAAEPGDGREPLDHSSDAHYSHDVTWTGAALGLTLHSILAGVALAAAVAVDWQTRSGAMLAGFGTFLVIFLHKPLDAMSLGTLMARGRWSVPLRHLVNGLFALAIPAGAVLFHAGAHATAAHGSRMLADALAFSAGVFLCIALSDLLPELHFHRHDRVKLSMALLAGLAVAWLAGVAETHTHHHGDEHSHAATVVSRWEIE